VSDDRFGDALTAPFWEAARERRLVVQACTACGAAQFYPRPFCLACESDAVEWSEASGLAQVYSMTTVRIPIGAGFEPPYVVALVELDEGPRLVTNLVGDCSIGDRVRVAWRDRDPDPPLPVFEPIPKEG